MNIKLSQYHFNECELNLLFNPISVCILLLEWNKKNAKEMSQPSVVYLHRVTFHFQKNCPKSIME